MYCTYHQRKLCRRDDPHPVAATTCRIRARSAPESRGGTRGPWIRSPRRFFARPLILILALGPMTAAVGAQTDEDEPAGEAIETFVVTASRLPVPAGQAGVAFTVLEEEYLVRRQALTVDELLRASPGVAVSRSGALAQVRVRGAEANHALVLLDGIEIGDPALGGELDFSHMLADGVRRIEIVRGPLSALWGSDAVAGAINLISAPREYEQTLKGNLEAGQFDTRRAGVSAGAAGNAWGVDLSANHLSSDGQNISRAGNEADGYRNNTGRLVAEFSPSDLFLLRLIARRSESESQYDDTSSATGLPADSDHFTQRTHTVAGLQGRLSLRDGRWLHQGSITHSGSENHNFAAGRETSETSGGKLRLGYQSSLFFGRADPAAARPSITLGLDHEREDYVQRAAASSFGDPNRDLSTRSTGALAEFRMDARGRWSASAALRHDRNRDFGNALSWRASAVAHASRSVALHVAYGLGVKNPTFIERFGYLSNFIGNPELLPEESRGWEAGVTLGGPGDDFSARLIGFSERLLNEINGFVFDPAAGGFTAANRPGKSRRHGLELQTRWKAGAALTFMGAYTYLRSKEPDADGGAVHEVRRPRHSGNLDIHYRMTEPRLEVNLNLDFTGERSDLFFPPWPNPSRRVWLDSFLRASLTAAWQATPRMRWHIRIDNLGQVRHEEVLGFRGPDRSIHMGVQFSLHENSARR